MVPQLSHINMEGRAYMVDVSSKPDTNRVAIARGEVHVHRETFELLREGNMKKGDVLIVAQLAGAMAAKRTFELIPLCHSIPLTHVDVQMQLDDTLPGVQITATVSTTGKTGVEMEALTAVSVAALTVYDMVKAVDKKMHIENIRLAEKYGGQSGDVVNE